MVVKKWSGPSYEISTSCCALSQKRRQNCMILRIRPWNPIPLIMLIRNFATFQWHLSQSGLSQMKPGAVAVRSNKDYTYMHGSRGYSKEWKGVVLSGRWREGHNGTISNHANNWSTSTTTVAALHCTYYNVRYL